MRNARLFQHQRSAATPLRPRKKDLPWIVVLCPNRLHQHFQLQKNRRAEVRKLSPTVGITHCVKELPNHLVLDIWQWLRNTPQYSKRTRRPRRKSRWIRLSSPMSVALFGHASAEALDLSFSQVRKLAALFDSKVDYPRAIPASQTSAYRGGLWKR